MGPIPYLYLKFGVLLHAEIGFLLSAMSRLRAVAFYGGSGFFCAYAQAAVRRHSRSFWGWRRLGSGLQFGVAHQQLLNVTMWMWKCVLFLMVDYLSGDDHF